MPHREPAPLCHYLYVPGKLTQPLLHLGIKALEASTFNILIQLVLIILLTFEDQLQLEEKLYFLVSAKLCVMSFCNNYQGLG